MSQRSNDNMLDPFGVLRNVRDANMEAWSKIMQQWTTSEAYSQATGALLDAYLTSSAPFRRLLEQTMTQVLTTYNMPVRSDITNLAERLTAIELRLDDIEAQLNTLHSRPSTPAGDLVNEQGQTLHIKNVPSEGSTRRTSKTKE